MCLEISDIHPPWQGTTQNVTFRHIVGIHWLEMCMPMLGSQHKIRQFGSAWVNGIILNRANVGLFDGKRVSTSARAHIILHGGARTCQN